DCRRPDAHLQAHAQRDAARRRRVLRRDLGCVSDPDDESLAAGDGDLLDDARQRDLSDVHDGRAPAVRPARPAPADAGLGAGSAQLAALQVDVLLPDRGARGPSLGDVFARRTRDADPLDGHRGLLRLAFLARVRQALFRGRELMLRPLRIGWLYFRLGAMNELQYRANFVVALFQSLLALGVALVVLKLVYSHTTELNGWSEAELLCVLGIQILMGGVIHAAIQPNMERLAEEVRDGKLDYPLTKPEDAQQLVSVREMRIWQT